MYKVFLNDRLIILSTQKDFGKDFTSMPIKKTNLQKVLKKVESGKLKNLNLYHKKEEKLLKHLKKKLKTVIAGGGLVINRNGKILFIHRKGRWDLPKGKTEKNETIEESAVREVIEETQVKDLVVKKLIQPTYHIISTNDSYKLKETFWFEMHTKYTGELKPETAEGIDQAVWKDLDGTKAAIEDTYQNIKLLFPYNFQPIPEDKKVF